MMTHLQIVYQKLRLQVITILIEKSDTKVFYKTFRKRLLTGKFRYKSLQADQLPFRNL